MSKEERMVRPAAWPINAFTESGIDLAQHLNELVAALDSTNFTTESRPDYLTAGGLWTQQVQGGKVSLWMYTGSSDILIGDTDGIGPDQINMTEILEYLEVNLDFGVVTFKGRDGEVVPEEGDYTIELMGDVGLSSLVKDDYLQWNGSSWENNPPKLIETELNFMGGYDVTTNPPAGPEHGDMYINNTAGIAAGNWIGIAGQYVNVGNAMGYSKNHNSNGDKVTEGTGGCWFLMGEVYSGGITSVGAGSGISVDSSTPSTPVVSVNKTTLDGWYQIKGDYKPNFTENSAFNKNFGTTAGTVAQGNHTHSEYALSGHTHTQYSPTGHTHSEYEPKIVTKYTAFNKNFGSQYTEVARGDHTHTGYSPTTHTHTAASITAGTFASNAVYYFKSGLDLGDRLNVTYIDASSVIRSKADVIAYYTSDERLKDNIKPIESALEKVLKLRGVEYDWNDKQDIYEGHDYSVIAQDVEAVFPELVREQASGFKGVKIEKLIAPLIEGLRELSEEVRVLKAEVASLKGDD